MRPQLAESSPRPLVDVVFENHVTLVCLRFRTRAAREWVRQHVDRPDFAESPWALYCTVDAAKQILMGMASAGLEIESGSALAAQRTAA
jgi:hypothetical protein